MNTGLSIGILVKLFLILSRDQKLSFDPCVKYVLPLWHVVIRKLDNRNCVGAVRLIDRSHHNLTPVIIGYCQSSAPKHIIAYIVHESWYESPLFPSQFFCLFLSHALGWFFRRHDCVRSEYDVAWIRRIRRERKIN